MLAIVINNLDNSYFCRSLLKNVEQLDDVYLFYANLDLTNYIVPAPLFNIEHLYNFSGKVVCCDRTVLPICKAAPKVKDVYYYVWNLDWIHQEIKKYSEMKYIYQNTKLLARSPEQAIILENTWNNKPIVVEDFNYEQLKGL